MDTEFIFLVLGLVFIFTLVLYLIKRNKKDKDEVIRFLNETEIQNEPKAKDDI